MLNHSALSRDNGPLIFRPEEESPLRVGYETSGDPCGRLTKRFPWMGGEPGPNRCGLQHRPYTRLADSSDIPLCRESHSRELQCSRRGPPCTDPSSPYQEFRDSEDSENLWIFENSLDFDYLSDFPDFTTPVVGFLGNDQENEDYPLPTLQRAPRSFRPCSFSCYRSIDWISTGYLRQHPLIQEFLDREVLSLHADHRKARFPLP